MGNEAAGLGFDGDTTGASDTIMACAGGRIGVVREEGSCVGMLLCVMEGAVVAAATGVGADAVAVAVAVTVCAAVASPLGCRCTACCCCVML